ncbi:MAG TPA: SUMF1/EgtB/PvdO family nonheme iron enzyme [Bacteroidia bacterium]|nr:SUMF1/EgtB/PvdO family nonheme iron enzyme [Bacteroidia bacterium]
MKPSVNNSQWSVVSRKAALTFVFLISFFTFNIGQKNTLSKRQISERDSLMAVSILNLDSNFVFVQGGTFAMGLPDSSDVEGGEIQKPQHKVKLKSFYILKTHVTQALWYSIMDTNPSIHKECFTCPVENITWYDAQKFIAKLNKIKKEHYRLPTEAEFEYAAGGGNKGHGLKYSGSNNINEVGWFEDNSGSMSHPVGEKKPNELGLVDMSGDMWEWCSDWFEMYYYKVSPSDNPQGPAKGTDKILRGGCWFSLDEGCMVASRGQLRPELKNKYTGFRIVKDISDK